MKTRTRIAVVAALLVAMGGMAQAELISVDFVWNVNTPPCSDDTTAADPVKNAVGQSFTGQTGLWNAFDIDAYNYGNYSYGSAGPSGPLSDGNGNPTTVTLEITSSYRNGASSGPAGGNLREELAYLYPQAGLSGNTLTWELAGLDLAKTYALTIFGTGGGSNYLANGSPGVVDAEGDADWAAVTPDAGLKIAGSFDFNGHTPGMYGLQLFTADSGGAIPEPATMCALGLAVAGLGGYVRRRRRS